MTSISISQIDLQDIKAVVFDLDGTLYNKHHLPLRLIFSDMRHMFMLASERRARRLLRGQDFGNPEAFYRSLFDHIAGHQNMPYMLVREWYFEQYMPLTVRLLEKHYYAGEFAEPLLKDLRERGIKTAVFSDYGWVEKKLTAIGLDPELFDYRFAAPQMGGLKPNKHLFEKVAKTMGIEPKNILMIGDREDTDGDGARAAGMRYMKV